MKLSGTLSKVMDNYLCLRGIASIKALALASEIDNKIQRDLLQEHKDEMKDFLEQGEYVFFPEVILSMNLGLSEEDEYNELLSKVNSADKGFNQKVGKVKINFRADDNKLIDDRRHIKVAQFEFDEQKNGKIMKRIDGNHRLSAAEYLTNDILIPFCIIVFPNYEEAKNNSRAIFHNINSKQIPLELEQSIKIIIESTTVFADSTLKRNQPFGWHYYCTRELLCGTEKLDFACFTHIKNLVFETKYSFFTELFRYLLKENLISEATAVDDVKKEMVAVDNALNDANIATPTENPSFVGALAYYKLADKNKYDSFIKWASKNHIAEAKSVGIDDIVNIFDKVYDNIPKKVFLARWYPDDTSNEKANAQHRLAAIKKVVEDDLELELVDMGTRVTGTFNIRTVMYRELSTSDIFIADLSGSRHNVMVEVGHALKHINTGNVIFYFQKNVDKSDSVPFDLNGFEYDEINDSAEIEQKVKPRIVSILNNI
ncbi:MAG: hypothetical protein LBT88_07325 [Oscillospiraceae bacterium]|jgi:hypothetical protein|nr:hypothetical protein [Oscillospiraceae bacterium]